MYDGFLNIHKPAGISSFDAVKMILGEILEGKRPEKRLKIGHAGTLDPLADGVLVLAIDRASRLITRVQNQKKTYVATFELGVSSPSEDTETAAIPVENAPIPERTEIESVFPEFLGKILQRPPIYSALKVNGKKAYDLARKGKEVELAPRPIMIYSLKIINYSYPFLKLEIVCGSGTYIRSLGRDLGARLGSAAIMTALTRTAIGVFHLEDALELRLRDDPKPLNRAKCTEYIRPFLDAVPDLPRLTYGSEDVYRLKNGIPVIHPDAADFPKHTEAVVLNEEGKFLRIVQKTKNGAEGELRSVLNFANE